MPEFSEKIKFNLLAKWRFVVAVAQDSRLSSSAKVVAVLLADHLNTLTGRCDPSVARLEAMAGLSRTQTKKALKALASAGWIEKDARPGRSTAFSLRFDRIPDTLETRSDSRPGAGAMDTPDPVGKPTGGWSENRPGGGRFSDPEHENRTREKNIGGFAPSRAGGCEPVALLVTEPEFVQWTETFPNGHRDPHRTRPAYVAARRAGARSDELLIGARRYAIACAGRAPDKVAHPARWLQDRRWLDDPAPTRSGPTPTPVRMSAYDAAMAMLGGTR